MKTLGYTKGLIYSDKIVDGTAGAATSKVVYCAGAKAVGISLTANKVDDTMNRTMTLTVEVNIDNGDSYCAYNMLIDNLANSNAQQFTRVASKQRNAEGTDVLWFTPETLGPITRFRTKLALNVTGTAGTFDVNSTVIY